MFENMDLWVIVGMVVVALGGVVAGGIGWAVKKVEKVVKASATELDDKVWASVKDGLREALEDLQDEADAEIEATLLDAEVDAVEGVVKS